jgi:hypothetical protein
VIEIQVDEEFVSTHFKCHLPAYEGKTSSQFQQEARNIANQG